LVYQKHVLYNAVGLWTGDCVKVEPHGSCYYAAAKTQSGIYALVVSAVSHFADNIYPSANGDMTGKQGRPHNEVQEGILCVH
jgi:hypothetical protein